MLIKIYLTVVGLIYAALAVWCAVDPETTSQKVGFSLSGGSGQSEFLTVYGGLEFGMALMFLSPWFKDEFTLPMLWACLLVHASLVLFRTAGFLLFTNLEGMTYRLAIGEWVIFLLALIVLWFGKNGSTPA